MYADPHALLDLARALQARAEELRDLAHAARRDAAVVDWEGLAAEAMRAAVAAGCRTLLALAEEYDVAAALVADHARVVGDRIGLAAAEIELVGDSLSWVGHQAEELARRLEDVA